MSLSNITMIIKTFERPDCIRKLVKSIYKYYPEAIVLIGDDSEVSCKDEIEGKYKNKQIKVYELPKDSGLSFGRNFLLEKVDTPYFLLLDDDFVFDNRTKIVECLNVFMKNDIDILGGLFRNYKIINHWYDNLIVFAQKILRYELTTNYIGTIDFDENTKILTTKYELHRFPKYEKTDIVHNFFIAKTDKVRNENLWDNDLKLQEHTPFFFEAKKKGFKVYTTNQLSVRHMPKRMKKYNSFRGRDFVQVFMHKYNINQIRMSNDDGVNKVINKKDKYD
ncbi:GT2 family glycosyltransferase [Breznakia blatticola]|uniref:GT2 family glycosyltransferase n=1 Tax=Breznakia blatticola TaxID=1754012 RepID=A0A4R7Z943_9FIRM|nr:glycosyltransferase [Breznakia blatticola]TDW13953.1 GT2 family glycosyltransferase [Breznakia blatticola]